MKILLALSISLNLVLISLFATNYRLFFPDEDVKLHLEKRQALYLRKQELGSSESEDLEENDLPLQGFDTAPRQEIRISKKELNKDLENLPSVLKDARAVPYIEPGAGGSIGGFKLVSIKPGSIYEKLGLKQGDVIKGVNGNRLNSPQKAMELYQHLKKGGQVEIQLLQEGAPKNIKYHFDKEK